MSDVQDAACVPYSASHFAIDRAVRLDGMTVDIRRFGWTQDCDSEINWPDLFIHYGLAPTAPGALMRLEGETHFRSPGNIVFLPGGNHVATRCRVGEVRSLCLTVSNDRLRDMADAEGAGTNDVRAAIDLRDAHIEQALIRLTRELRDPGFASHALIESMVIGLVIEMCRHLKGYTDRARQHGGKLATWQIRRLKERIEADLSATISIPALARECGISARHLIRTFRNTEGITISEYVAARRLDHACERLVRRDALIKEIAADCGFGNPASFSAAFRRAMGQTPRQYRAQAPNWA